MVRSDQPAGHFRIREYGCSIPQDRPHQTGVAVPAVSEHLDQPGFIEPPALSPGGAVADVKPLAHGRVRGQAVMAPRDTGERQKLVGVQPIDGADVTGFGRLLDLGLPLPDALAGFM
jgi:hypothetical protein